MTGNRHALQVPLLERRVGGSHGVHLGRKVGPPVQRHQVEVGESGRDSTGLATARSPHPLFHRPKIEHGNRIKDGTFRGGAQAFKLDT
jgi:hypothetical protein